MANTNAISVSADFNMTALAELLKNNKDKTTIIIINNNGTPIDMTNVIDSTATEAEVKKRIHF